ncbi:HNH endonuclease signature motif containing protein [Arthrobacter sp. TMS2-4]
MAIAPIEPILATPSPLGWAREALAECARDVGLNHRIRTRTEAAQFIVEVEHASKIVDYLQILAARLAEEHKLADTDGDERAGGALLVRAEQSLGSDGHSGKEGEGQPVASDNGFRNCAEYLRATLGISRAEAKRRLTLAELVLPRISPTGAPVPPRLTVLGAAMTSGHISGRAATVIAQALHRVDSFATPQHLESMEHHLTRQGMEADEDILRVLARRWESVLDQDGREPTDKVLRARQGVFLKGRRHGLHFLEIGATDEQFEHLATVMNSTANPRCVPGQAGEAVPGRAINELSDQHHPSDPDSCASFGHDAQESVSALGDPPAPTRAQTLLDGLVAACRVALSTATLPSTGGYRPQVMVTIDQQDLVSATHRAGYAVFSGQMSAGSIRKLACDADIIPVVLGSSGQVLDVGRAQRLFPPHLRRALVARDKGCAFPDCSIPASWCEAHHIKPWSHGGTTSIANGVLLCSRHHHVIHQGGWTVESRNGIPWFTAPRALGPPRTARRNRYWQAGQAVDEVVVGHASGPRPEVSEHNTDVLEHSPG